MRVCIARQPTWVIVAHEQGVLLNTYTHMHRTTVMSVRSLPVCMRIFYEVCGSTTLYLDVFELRHERVVHHLPTGCVDDHRVETPFRCSLQARLGDLHWVHSLPHGEHLNLYVYTCNNEIGSQLQTRQDLQGYNLRRDASSKETKPPGLRTNELAFCRTNSWPPKLQKHTAQFYCYDGWPPSLKNARSIQLVVAVGLQANEGSEV